MTGETTGGVLENSLLLRVLSDPETGLPNVPYFRLIRDWEERRAARRGGRVRVVRLQVGGGDERLRRSMPWRLCREFRTSDIIASEGIAQFRLLLTSPDADNAEAVVERVRRLETVLNEQHPSQQPLAITVELEDERVCDPREPCAPPDPDRMNTPTTPHPKYEGGSLGTQGGSR